MAVLGQKQSVAFLSIADDHDLNPARLISILSSHCPYCDGALGIRGAIKEPSVIVRILGHMWAYPRMSRCAHRRRDWIFPKRRDQ